jgi:hypothetical protein
VSATDGVDAVLDLPFLFRDRPTSAPPDLRPIWRVPLVVLLVRACSGGKATHEQLHVLNWAIRSVAGAETLARYLAEELAPERAIVRFDPALDRAVALARGLALVSWKTKYWTLTPVGARTAAELDDAGLLDKERTLLATLPKPLTQAAVARLLQRGDR